MAIRLSSNINVIPIFNSPFFTFQENIAFRKPTKQNDVGLSPTRPSSRAVDGNSETVLDPSCTASNLDVAFTNPWWRVDLEQLEPVNEVYIVNRGDCCGERLNPFEIRVGKRKLSN
ncbi:PREDICTED: fucolectin-like [Acropora digitifera]|uniref:fucolectin-like n=1 Tax=Acropora digitifera TaxID=70779 RepID=UPI00077AD706|nr:PREDICTED: fucolectin-like [Acropora digitifera]